MSNNNIVYDIKQGTAATNNLPDRIEDLPKHDIEIFQAECIQNIYDAKSKLAKQSNLPVEIDFFIDEMSLTEIDCFKNFMGSDFFDKILNSYKKSDSQDVKEQMGKVISTLKNNKWIGLRIIEKNTTGLTGYEDPNSSQGQKSKFNALLRATNKTEKDEAVSGGTFGKGSSVYTYCSGLWMWFAYSILEKSFVNNDPSWKGDKITYSRFMGRGIIAPYVDRDEKITYLGTRWFARDQNALPFINDRADKFAKEINLPIRNKQDYGTSYFIPAFFPDDEIELNVDNIINKLKNEIVKKWFIPINQNQLICRIGSINNVKEKIIIDKLYIDEKVPELRFKIEILNWYYSNARPKAKFIKHLTIPIELPIIKESYRRDYPYAAKQKKIDVDLIVREIESESEFVGFNTVNRIGLTRNYGMIINHYPYISENNDNDENPLSNYLVDKKFEALLFVGKISIRKQTQEEIMHSDLFFGFAENPAHNTWISNERDINRCRLKRFELNPAPYPWNRINRFYLKINQEIRNAFPKEDNIPLKRDICNFWKKIAHIHKSGEISGGQRNFHYNIINEGYIESKYFWEIMIGSNVEDKILEINFDNFLNSIELGKEKDFSIIGIDEFNEFKIEVDDLLVNKVFLKPKEKKKLRITTCNIIKNKIFKNLQPIIEIQDKIYNDNTTV
jgi:hypothetical protein